MRVHRPRNQGGVEMKFNQTTIALALAVPVLLMLPGCGCESERYYCDEDG